MEKREKKNQTDLEATITNKHDNQKAGYGGRDFPTNKQSSTEEE